MRYRAFLLVVIVGLLSPTNLSAQIDRATPANTASPAEPAKSALPCPTKEDYKRSAARSNFVSYHKVGQTLQVRLANQQNHNGKLSEVQSDYFVLASSKGLERIAFTDVESVKVKKGIWQRVRKVLLITVEAPVIGVLYGGFYTLVGIGYVVDRITGHESGYE